MGQRSEEARSVSMLFAALVEALDEKSPGIATSFARHLDAMRATPDGGLADESDVIAETKALLRDGRDRSEPASVVYAKNWAPEEEQLPSTSKVQLPTLEEAVLFWAKLPSFDQEHATVETASGHRLEPAALASLAKRYKERPLAASA